MKPRRTIPPADRFWRFIQKTADCWNWTGRNMSGRYGLFRVRRGLQKAAHRMSWELAHGPIPDGMVVCHKCDNPLCVRPDHLFIGTQRDNCLDCSRKGRTLIGERNGNSRLSKDQVLAIRSRVADGERIGTVARIYGIAWISVQRIVRHRTWRHVA